MAPNTHGSFVWYELFAADPAAALPFYAAVFGWSATASEQPGAHSILASTQGPLGSVSDVPEQAKAMGAGPFWNSVVQVDDVDAVAARAKELGGRTYHEPTDYPGAGRLAVIADPFGAVLNIIAPATIRAPHDRAQPGEVCWHELLSSDHEAAFAFYSALFGWKKSNEFDMGPIGKYLLFGRDGTDFGGMFTKPKDVPVSAWLYYFQVTDIEAAVVRAEQAGGKLCNGPMPVPSGARIAQLTDAQGAMFAIHENPKPR